jgi:penicillin-binding protein 1A
MLKLFFRTLALVFVLVAVTAAGGLVALWHFSRGLPDYQQLINYQPPVLTRFHAGDGRVLAEFAVERRLFVPIDAVPKLVIHAFLAAEDKNFYSHPGISLPDIARAAVIDLVQKGTMRGRRPVGASTITQQVAKNFLLSNEVSLSRKIREAILAVRIENAMSKDRILELYLNEIYLGSGTYGIAAAALNYFNKSLDDLTIPEAAFIAGLPKAPNNYNPERFPEAAKARRDYVIDRMEDDGWITHEQAEQARATPLVTRQQGEADTVRADYFVEDVRREIVQRFGEKALYRGGLSVRTTLDSHLQEIADQSLRDGLMVYDERHGWRGPITKLDVSAPDWPSRLAVVPRPAGFAPNWYGAVVLKLTPNAAEIGFADGSRGLVPFPEMAWARRNLPDQTVGPAIHQPSDALAVGDVIAVQPIASPPGQRFFALRQIPNVDGAIVALDPHTGRVLAMTGGWSYELTQFNRATQALRQPGSAFKPFVYMAALENGFTPASLVLDGPITIDQGPGLGKWKPNNFEHNFLGPSTLRVGVEKSRNLMTVRVAEAIGMDKVIDMAKRFDVADNLQPLLSTALGAADTTLLRLTTAYAEIVNGGLKITPTLIDRVQDRNGHTIFRHDDRPCPDCREAWTPDELPPTLPDNRVRIIDAPTAYQMVSILQGVVERGTGHAISALNLPLAGKTGTSNEANDTWFVGFSPDLAVGVFVGFDQPRTLGPREQGATVAVPIWKEFMADALKNKPVIPFRVPPGIRLVRINERTGQLARAGDRDVIWEAFKPGTEASIGGPVLDFGTPASPTLIPTTEAGGLY